MNFCAKFEQTFFKAVPSQSCRTLADILTKITLNKDLKRIFHHFLFRLKQSLRIFNWMPKISFPLILVLGGLMLLKLPSNNFYPILFFLLVTIFHFNRKDIPFLKKTFIGNWQLILFLENAFIYTLFLLININYKIEYLGLILLFGFLMLCFVYPKYQRRWLLKWNFIPNYLFEWKSYLRKNSWIAIIIIIISVFSGYHPATLIFFGIFVLEYISMVFENNESKEMLEMYFKKYDIKFKIRKNLLFLNFLLLPSYLVFLIFNYQEIFYLIYYFVFMNLYCFLIITRKYKVYSHKEKTNFYNMGVFLEYFFCSATIIPAIFVLNSNLKSTKENLSNYVGN